MLSRVAENVYWLARYVERAEGTARLVNVNAHLLLDLPKGIAPGWQPLVSIMGADEDYRESYADYDERSVVRFLVADASNPGSILSSLAFAREDCRTIRDIVPREAWELINELYWYAKDNAQSGVGKRNRHGYLREIILHAQTLAGLLDGTMNHDAGYEFLSIGRMLERADMTTRIVDVRSATLLPETATGLLPFENIQWIGVLKSLTAYQMYRQTMHVRVRRADALRFLVHDVHFPRAVGHCLEAVASSLAMLPRNRGVQRELAHLRRRMQGADIAAMSADATMLHAFLDELQEDFALVHEGIARTWFLHEEADAEA